jgi:small GTP-binding protein
MFKGTQGIILVYDITNRDTFLNIKKWSNHIKDSANKDVCILLVGNKSDKEINREVTYDDGAKVAKEYNFIFLEMSAKNNINIKEGFEILVKEMYRTYGDKTKSEKIEIKPKEKKKDKCC